MSQKYSALLIIGNEILSGRTQDKNINYLAVKLSAIGSPLHEVRIVRDDEPAIIKAVNELRTVYDYVFTTGGIGPTHDDITSHCIAKAMGRKYELNAEAEAILRTHYRPDEINEARLNMARMPEGAQLLPNPITAAPGYRVENVFVMAGVPQIMQAMFDYAAGLIKHGQPVQSTSIITDLREGVFAAALKEIQEKNTEVEIGSYPHFGGQYSATLVISGISKQSIEQTVEQIKIMLNRLGGTVKE